MSTTNESSFFSDDDDASISSTGDDGDAGHHHPLVMGWGVAEAKGMRLTMEDAHAVHMNLGGTGYAYFGVYDGHGSAEVADMARDALHNTIIRAIKEMQRTVDLLQPVPSLPLSRELAFMHNAIREGILIFDETVTRSPQFCAVSKDAGCTAVCVVVRADDFFCANVGDSEAVLLTESKRRPGTYVPDKLTEMHRPNTGTENKRIAAAGGKVMFNRVEGVLAVSRSLGDGAFKTPLTAGDEVSGDPFVTHRKIQKGESVLVIACDGLWDVLSANEVADLVATYKYNCVSASDAAQMLVTAALDKNTMDNVTCVVVYIAKR